MDEVLALLMINKGEETSNLKSHLERVPSDVYMMQVNTVN